MSITKYTKDFKKNFLIDGVDGAYFDGENFEFICPVCGKKYTSGLEKSFKRFFYSEVYKRERKLPCPNRECASLFKNNLDYILRKQEESYNKTITEKYGSFENYNQDRFEKSKDAIFEKYGSFKGMSEKIWKAYYEKTGYTHNMRNPESIKKNQRNRVSTILSMPKEKKKKWYYKRLETHKKNGTTMFGGGYDPHKYHNYHSKIGDKFCKELSDMMKGYTVFFGDSEYMFRGDKTVNYHIDFYIKELNVGVEFYGNYWHANPLLYESDEEINYFGTKMFAKEVWQKDESREDFMSKKYGIKFINVWESDYESDSKKTLLDIFEKIRSISNE